MINYHNIVFPFLHRHGCRQEADSNFRDFARTSQIKSSIRQSRSLRINNKSWKTNSFQVNFVMNAHVVGYQVEVVSKRWHNLFYILQFCYIFFWLCCFSSCIWQQVAIFQLYRVINSPINIYLATVMSPFPSFISLAHIFLILKAIAKKAKSIVTLSSPTCRNLLYAMLYFICPKTASGSIHRLPLCLTPSFETNLSRACRLY